MGQGKNILVCPLDWGLGHATRMVPVIDLLEKKGAQVIIAADKRPLDFLLQRFPNNTFVKLKGFIPKYPEKGSMSFSIIRSLPEMLRKARVANRELQKIIDDYKIDAVISDNRYELYSDKVPCIFVTHQLNIQTRGWQKIGKPVINLIINHYINKYDELWVPDIDGDFQLSGKLSGSGKYDAKRFNIGLLSRFSATRTENKLKNNDILIILSGPEPQRTVLEELLLTQALGSKLKTVILLGKPGERIQKTIKNVKLISHLPDEELSELIRSSKIIISRPGYTTLMDLAILGNNAVFIPTPGQTEQEYLANRLLNHGIAFSQNQSTFSLVTALNNQNLFKGLFIKNNPSLLEARINNLINISPQN